MDIKIGQVYRDSSAGEGDVIKIVGPSGDDFAPWTIEVISDPEFFWEGESLIVSKEFLSDHHYKLDEAFTVSEILKHYD